MIEEDDAAGQVDTSIFPLDAELLLAASHEEEKRVGATAVQARKEKKERTQAETESGKGKGPRAGRRAPWTAPAACWASPIDPRHPETFSTMGTQGQR